MRVALNVGLLGCGHIASALAQGWAALGPASESPVVLWGYDIRPEATAQLATSTGLTPAASPEELADHADVLVVAVRPTEVPTALAGVAADPRSSLTRRRAKRTNWLSAEGPYL